MRVLNYLALKMRVSASEPVCQTIANTVQESPGWQQTHMGNEPYQNSLSAARVHHILAGVQEGHHAKRKAAMHLSDLPTSHISATFQPPQTLSCPKLSGEAAFPYVKQMSKASSGSPFSPKHHVKWAWLSQCSNRH